MVDFKRMLERRRRSRERFDDEDSPTGIPGKQFTTQVSVSVAGPDYAIKFDYDRALLDKIKQAVPESERTWHKGRKVWLVSPESIQQAMIAIEKIVGRTIVVPPVDQLSTPEVIEKSFLLEYLGTTKDRGRRVSAYGSVNGNWASEFPEDVLKNYFEGREKESKPDGLQTLYQVLCVFEKASPEEINKAFKRLARQWHPDVCREENAHEMFVKIKDAHAILIDPEKKKRYDAGLYFERQANQPRETLPINSKYGYRSPLRCGQITAKGTVRLMRFTVSEIIKWDDVVDSQGRVMSTSWPKGSETFVTEWLNQSPF